MKHHYMCGCASCYAKQLRGEKPVVTEFVNRSSFNIEVYGPGHTLLYNEVVLNTEMKFADMSEELERVIARSDCKGATRIVLDIDLPMNRG